MPLVINKKKCNKKLSIDRAVFIFLSCFVILVVMGIVLICKADGRGH